MNLKWSKGSRYFFWLCPSRTWVDRSKSKSQPLHPPSRLLQGCIHIQHNPRCPVLLSNTGPPTGTDTPITNPTVFSSLLLKTLITARIRDRAMDISATTIIIRTQDSYDKSLVVSDHDQIQYQICSTPLIHPPRLPFLPRLQQVPVRILLQVPQDELTVSQVATSPILTSHVPHFPVSRVLEDPHPWTPRQQRHQRLLLPTNRTSMKHKFLSGRETGNLWISSVVLSDTSPKKKHSKPRFLVPSWPNYWPTLVMKFLKFSEFVLSSLKNLV